MGLITGIFLRTKKLFDKLAVEYINKIDVSDVMIERPVSFSIKKKHYSVFPATLGKMQLLARLLEAIGLDKFDSKQNLHNNILEAAQTHRDDCLRIVAYYTLPGADCLDENIVSNRLSELSSIDDVDIATLLMAGLSLDKYELIVKQYAIDVEAKRMQHVMRVKSNKNNVSFGARSVWGAIIDNACERYGWSYQYVLWGISYCNLRLLLADQSRSVYLTDDERKKLHISNDRDVVRADDVEALNRLVNSRSWK